MTKNEAVHYGAIELFYQPMEEVYEDEGRRRVFQDHYYQAAWQQIIDQVYGGYPLKTFFSDFHLESNEDDLRARRATIRLLSSDPTGEDLVLKRMSLRQFLVSGLPLRKWLPWDGKGIWSKLDAQYRLEICQSEISRWSIFFKRAGVLLSGVEAEGHEPFSDIELVNNCTTTRGFELRVRRDGVIYHGSFGKEKNLEYLYSRLSQWQAGSLAHQDKKLVPKGSGLDFFDFYHHPVPLKDGRLDPKYRLPISLERYRETSGQEKSGDVKINQKAIDYRRWGSDSEYFQKPQARRLLKKIVGPDGKSSAEPPETYKEIATAKKIVFPNFPESGIYDLSEPASPKKYYRWLYELKRCRTRYQEDGRLEIELRRIGPAGKYQLRRIVFGNLDPRLIPVYPRFWTLHRFGYGARDTVMDYEPDYLPSSESPLTSHFAYLLGGEDEDPGKADNYINGEGFGVERAIFSWQDYERTRLVIDLISFERILPLWQGTIAFDDLS